MSGSNVCTEFADHYFRSITCYATTSTVTDVTVMKQDWYLKRLRIRLPPETGPETAHIDFYPTHVNSIKPKTI